MITFKINWLKTSLLPTLWYYLWISYHNSRPYFQEVVSRWSDGQTGSVGINPQPHGLPPLKLIIPLCCSQIKTIQFFQHLNNFKFFILSIFSQIKYNFYTYCFFCPRIFYFKSSYYTNLYFIKSSNPSSNLHRQSISVSKPGNHILICNFFLFGEI